MNGFRAEDELNSNRPTTKGFSQNMPWIHLPPINHFFMPSAEGVSARVNAKTQQLAGIIKEYLGPRGRKFERDADGTPNSYILATAMNISGISCLQKHRIIKKVA
jgi:hypothetical protein